MHDWETLLTLTDHELSRRDIGAMSLACAHGLPGNVSLDIDDCLRKLDRWADQVREHTSAMAALFDRSPDAYNRSWAFFRIMAMVTVLQRDLGVHYDMELVEAEDSSFFGRAEHLFVHGPLQGLGGTCSSLPPLFVAVGRRLGYPLKLVKAPSHLFARWDEPDGERFNIECTSRGLVSYPDEYYRTWPRPMTEDEIARYGMLRSLTPRQELAGFLGSRGRCFLENRQFRMAVSTYARVCELNPGAVLDSACLLAALKRWQRALDARLALGFPSLTIRFPPRRFHSLPRETEHEMVHLMTKENLLDEPKLDVAFWAPLRRDGRLPPSTPLAHIEVRYPSDSSGAIDISLFKSAPPHHNPMISQPR